MTRLGVALVLLARAASAQDAAFGETARSSLDKGDYAGAERAYAKARDTAHAASQPEQEAEALIGLLTVTDMRLAAGDTAVSLADADEWKEAAQKRGNPVQRQAAINLAGLIHIRANDLAGGLDLLRSLNMDEVNPAERYVYRYNLARAYELNEKNAQALDEYVATVAEEPRFTKAVDRAFDLVRQAGFGGAGFARICRAVGEGGGDVSECLTRARRDRIEAGALDLMALEIAIPSAPLDSHLPAYQEILTFVASSPEPIVDLVPLVSRFPSWRDDRRALAAALYAQAQKLRSENPPSPNTVLLALFLASWALDHTQVDAGAQGLLMLRDNTKIEHRRALIASVAAHTEDPKTLHLTPAQRDQASTFHTTLGELLNESGRCEESALEQWRYATLPGSRRVPAMPHRYLADCYRKLGNKDDYAREKYGLSETLSGQLAIRKPEGSVRYHVFEMFYPGAWLKSSIQAALQQELDTPQQWGQGAAGFGKRLASSQATRAVRYTIALGFNYAFAQEPRYVLCPRRGFSTRLKFVFKQTLFSRGATLGWEPPYWRIGSAFGSEAISQAWRPPGPGTGARNGWSWAARGAFVLGGDTASNFFREFLPRNGRWGKLFSPFL